MINPKQLAFCSPDHHTDLLDELKLLKMKVIHQDTTTCWIQNDLAEPVWAQAVWRDLQTLEIESIADAQRKLKTIAPIWRYHGGHFHRRGSLIAQKLNIFPENKEWAFPPNNSINPPPAFTMANPNLIFYSHQVSRPSLNGEIAFQENKTEPPSRAYLKIWEALTILGDWPKPNDRVVDLGSAPGSWTWALSQLGASVLSIDRAKLKLPQESLRNVTYQSGDAFSFKPEKMDWVFSDVICFPEKLFQYVSEWIQSGQCQKFVCSIKFTGKPDLGIIHRFRKLPNSRVLHLSHNKNEVTWIGHPTKIR